jgi:uncharacterized protein YbjT (DUF2867 family)
VARALIVGCGCRGRAVGKRLLARGWQVRGTSRSEEGMAAIAAAGIEAAFADPVRPGTVLELVDDVAVVAWLFGSAEGSPEELAAIHGRGLDRVVERMVETPVRGFVYEAAGSVDPILLARGCEALETATERWKVPLHTLYVDPNDDETWANPFDIWLDSATNAVLKIAGPSE